MDEHLARRARETAQDGADAAARARLLSSRLRAGLVRRARVELAAWLGDTASRVALGIPEEGPNSANDFERWAAGIEAHGRDVAVRAAVVATRHASAAAGVASRGIAGALQECEAWLTCPCEAHVASALGVSRARKYGAAPAEVVMGGSELEPGAERDAMVMVAVSLARCTAALVADRERRLDGLPILGGEVEWLFLGNLTAARILTRAAELVRCACSLSRPDANERVRTVVGEALIGWALSDVES